MLLFSSVHVIFGLLSAQATKISGAGIWALIVAFITLRDAVVLFAMESADGARKLLAALLVLLWLLLLLAMEESLW